MPFRELERKAEAVNMLFWYTSWYRLNLNDSTSYKALYKG